MKVTLEFNEEDTNEMLAAIHGMDWAEAMWDLDKWLREQIKYADKEYDEVRDMLHDIVRSYGLTFDIIV